MKKTSFVIAILASAMLAGACGGTKAPDKTTPPAGENAGSGSGEAPAAAGSGSGSAAQ